MKMWKKILISLAILLAILIIAAAVFIATFDIEKYKPQIISLVKQNLQREVSIDKLQLFISLPLNVGLKVKGIKMANEAGFSAGNFCQLDELSLSADLLPFILKKEIKVGQVTLVAPMVNLVINEKGEMNIPMPAPAAGQKEDSAKAALPIAAVISRLEIKNGFISFTQKNPAAPLSMDIADIDFSAINLSLASPVSFKGGLSFCSDQQNLRFSGTINIGLTPLAIRLERLIAQLELEKITMDKFFALSPALSSAGIKDKLSGRLNLELNKALVGQKGLETLDGWLRLDKGRIVLAQVPAALEDINANIKISPDILDMDKAGLSFAGGRIAAHGRISNYLVQPSFEVEAEVKDVNIGQLIPQKDLAQKFSGLANAQTKISGQGKAPEEIMKSLSGSANMSLPEAHLINMNVLRQVLDKISMLPELSRRIETSLPEKYKDILSREDTVFKQIKMDTKIENSRIVISNAFLSADCFEVEGRGEMSFASQINLKAGLFLPQDLSASMINAEPQLKFLLNNDSKIFVPFAVSGTLPQVQVMPDLEYLAKKLLMSKGQELFEQLLDQALKKDAPASQGQDATPPQQPSPEKEIIEDIFQGIFKKK